MVIPTEVGKSKNLKSLVCPTGLCRTIENSAEIGSTSNRLEEAAGWYAIVGKQEGQPVIPMIRERFRCSAPEAVKVIRRANEIRSAHYGAAKFLDGKERAS